VSQILTVAMEFEVDIWS